MNKLGIYMPVDVYMNGISANVFSLGVSVPLYKSAWSFVQLRFPWGTALGFEREY